MRVRVEFEAPAVKLSNGEYALNVPALGPGVVTVRMDSQYVTQLTIEEPTARGFYVLGYSTGIKFVAFRNSTGWLQVGTISHVPWLELGNIVYARKLNLDEPDRTSDQDSES